MSKVIDSIFYSSTIRLHVTPFSVKDAFGSCRFPSASMPMTLSSASFAVQGAGNLEHQAIDVGYSFIV